MLKHFVAAMLAIGALDAPAPAPSAAPALTLARPSAST